MEVMRKILNRWMQSHISQQQQQQKEGRVTRWQNSQAQLCNTVQLMLNHPSSSNSRGWVLPLRQVVAGCQTCWWSLHAAQQRQKARQEVLLRLAWESLGMLAAGWEGLAAGLGFMERPLSCSGSSSRGQRSCAASMPAPAGLPACSSRRQKGGRLTPQSVTLPCLL